MSLIKELFENPWYDTTMDREIRKVISNNKHKFFDKACRLILDVRGDLAPQKSAIMLMTPEEVNNERQEARKFLEGRLHGFAKEIEGTATCGFDENLPIAVRRTIPDCRHCRGVQASEPKPIQGHGKADAQCAASQRVSAPVEQGALPRQAEREPPCYDDSEQAAQWRWHAFAALLLPTLQAAALNRYGRSL